jgi:hypothetical protein
MSFRFRIFVAGDRPECASLASRIGVDAVLFVTVATQLSSWALYPS